MAQKRQNHQKLGSGYSTVKCYLQALADRQMSDVQHSQRHEGNKKGQHIFKGRFFDRFCFGVTWYCPNPSSAGSLCANSYEKLAYHAAWHKRFLSALFCLKTKGKRASAGKVTVRRVYADRVQKSFQALWSDKFPYTPVPEFGVAGGAMSGCLLPEAGPAP